MDIGCLKAKNERQAQKPRATLFWFAAQPVAQADAGCAFCFEASFAAAPLSLGVVRLIMHKPCGQKSFQEDF